MAITFLSYSHEDGARVDGLVSLLRSAGVQVWRDRDRLYAGQSWPKALGEAIAAADALVLLWSHHSAVSPFVELEWTTALALKIPVFPLQLDGTSLPPILKGVQALSGDDLEAATLKIQLGLAKLRPRLTIERAKEVIEGLNSIESREPQEVLNEARTVFRDHNWVVDGSVYQAGGDIHVNISRAQSPPPETKWWAARLNVLIGLVVGVLTIFTLIRPLVNSRSTDPTPDFDPQFVASIKPGVVRILSADEFIGSGFFVADRMVVTTSFIGKELHKLSQTSNSMGPRVKLWNAKRLNATVKRTDEKADLAVLNVQMSEKVSTLKLSRTVSQDDEVIAFLNSSDEEWTTVRGKVLRTGVDIPEDSDGREFKGRIEVNIKRSYGSPVINKRGEVIGVMQGSLPGKPESSILIPSEELRQTMSTELSTLSQPRSWAIVTPRRSM